MKEKIFYCQFSDNFVFDYTEDNIDNKYYKEIFKNDGFYKTEDFWEIPLWIAEADFFLKDNYDTSLTIIDTTINEFILTINNKQPNYLLFSVLDINKKYVKEILNKLDKNIKVILGGYIDIDYFKNDYFTNVIWLDNISDLGQILNVEYKYGNDYSLFKNTHIIPRLRLSSGCKYKCKFCTIDKNINEVDKKHIDQVVESFKDLNFKYIYIDDKTFGQASNYIYLKQVFKDVKKYNNNFLGFIIQTTANLISSNKLDFNKLHIKIVEFGLETYNNKILHSLKKPITEKNIDDAFKILTSQNIKIIPNIIIGIQGEDIKSYQKTLRFINKHIKDILFFNIYSLSVYIDTELESELNGNYIEEDSHENNLNKSFHNHLEVKNNLYMKDELYNIFFNNL